LSQNIVSKEYSVRSAIFMPYTEAITHLQQIIMVVNKEWGHKGAQDSTMMQAL